MSSKAGTHCCVINCSNNSVNKGENLKFYSFSIKPHKAEQTQKWISAIRRINADGSPWKPSKYSRICKKHFINNEKCDSPLSPSYLPTIFPAVYKKSNLSENFIESTTRRCKKCILKHIINSFNTDCINILQENIENRCQETQVDFLLETNSIISNYNMFICKTYNSNDKCEGETQANFERSVSAKLLNSKRMKDVIYGSDITFEDKCVGPEDYSAKRNCISKCKSGFHGYESIVSDEEMNNLAGVRIKVFQLLLTLIVNVSSEKISKENYLLLFFMNIKLGLSSSALGVLFNIHRTTASRYFKSSLQILVIKCKDLITWPSKETIKELLPDAFKDKYRNCRIIIDCTEFPTEQPAEISQRVQFYSHYKKGFTIKVLVGCTPNGYISLLVIISVLVVALLRSIAMDLGACAIRKEGNQKESRH
ncbi:uncharacterized protein [Prorops nasuta]|uniref:uncharacterized protein n=1 Tax=Prorops nasuta TaxID=863751 RepID=UPI0034CED5D1